MPTAAKLIAAACFAFFTFFAAETLRPLVPTLQTEDRFSLACAGIAALCGWFVMGRLVGNSYWQAMGYGLRTGATALVWILLFLGLREMLMNSYRNRYGGPTEALLDTFSLIVANAQVLATAPLVIGTMIIGSMASGIMTEWTSRRWA